MNYKRIEISASGTDQNYHSADSALSNWGHCCLKQKHRQSVQKCLSISDFVCPFVLFTSEDALALLESFLQVEPTHFRGAALERCEAL